MSAILSLVSENVVREIAKDINANLIGEGEHGFVLRYNNRVCIKNYKFEDMPNEYAMLKIAHDLQLNVPKPIKRLPAVNSMVMEYLEGSSLRMLFDAEEKFSAQLVLKVIETVGRFNEHFQHRDFAPRNVMLADIERKDGVIVDAEPFIIDLVTTQRGKSREFMVIRNWFREYME